MTRRTSAQLIILACLTAFSACGGADEASPSDPGPPQDALERDDDSASAAEDASTPPSESDAPEFPTEEDIAEADDGADASPSLADTEPPEEVDAGAPPAPSDALDDAQAGPGLDIIPSSDPCDPASPGVTREIVLPLGETLHMRGDDYLAFWGKDLACEVLIADRPEGANAEIEGGDAQAHRLTPDLAGSWTLTRGQDTVIVTVDADYLTPDTFVNYNYSPVSPLVQSDDGAMWVTSPVSNAVQRVVFTDAGPEADTLVPTGSWPTAIASWTSADGAEWLLVSQTGRDSLGFLDPDTRKLVDAIYVGNEPAGLIVDGDVAFVALSGEDRVAKVDLVSRQVSERIAVGHDPRAMVLDAENKRLFVASLLSSNSHPRGPIQGELVPSEDQRDVAVIDTETFTLSHWIYEIGTILRGLWLNADATELLVAASHSHNTTIEVDADSQPHTHRLMRVDVDLSSDALYTVIGEVDLDSQPSSMGPAPSPFTMATTPDGAHLLVTLAAGQAVLVLDAETREEVERLPSGSDPRGLAFAEGHFWTYAWLDNQLVGWPLPGAEGEKVALSVGDDPTPLEVKQGQRIFNDAAFSKHGEFSCNNCHIDGITDGLVWDILTDGPVNTLAFRNVGGSSPFLWGGQLPTLFDFSREVLKLVGANASGTQMSLVTTYMQSVTAPPNPYTLPGGKLSEAAQWGKEIFENEAMCETCHSGTLLTNQELVEGKTEGVMTDVPSLFGVYDTGPWGREGQWTTLEDMVAYAVEFTGAELSEAELDALNAYVREQPADRLYLTSSLPLNHSHHIWYETPIALTFSAALIPEQEELFSFWSVNAEGEASAVEGAWSASGRVVRFFPAEDLALNTAYRIDVEPGLMGSLGQVTESGMVIDFETGGLPGMDVSGNWDLQLCQSAFGCVTVEIALLQSDGGQVTGVTVDNIDEGEIDHLEGVVDGDILALDPFTIESVIGPIYVETGLTLEMVDQNSDGFADSGQGEIIFEFGGGSYPVQFEATRISLPDDAEASSDD